ncbi:MAG: SOS response-associated peptidase [Bacteroidales bacterium]|nr:SOS response-associated peptidase [Bacteroidales bacterium]
MINTKKSMCFTINIHTTRSAIEKRFNVNASALNDFDFRYFYRAYDNPLIPVVTQEDPQRVQLMNWGLIPNWVKEVEQAEQIKNGTCNARSESLDIKPSFKSALAKGRCWIIAKGFFEWQHLGSEKIPWYISNQDHALFAFAGLYDTWNNPDTGENEKSFSLVTTKANALMEKIHNTKLRMPVMLYIMRRNGLNP